MLYQQIPNELQIIPHWVCWQFERLDSGKLSKIPINARTGLKASVTDPDTWSDFKTACGAVNNNAAQVLSGGNYDLVPCGVRCGIGFVFSDLDLYAGIDIDDAAGDAALLTAHRKIIEAFPSYSELSPSRRGLHIIVKGKIKGARKHGVEAYSTERYFTFTGDVWRNLPIIDCQAMLDELQADLAPARSLHTILSTVPQTEDDVTIIARMLGAANGAKATMLAHGNADALVGTDRSHSAIDMALVNVIQFYTKNVEQIERIWLSTPHGQNPQRAKKMRRMDYRMRTIRLAFDREVAPVDFNQLQQQWQASPEQYRPTPPPASASVSIPPPLPPGLMGEVAQFIYDAATRQVPEIALAGAIGWFAGVCGKAYNINGAGLNMYLALLASSGSGKEAISSGYSVIEQAIVARGVIAVREFIGPANFSAPQAILKHVGKHGSFISLIGEFGGWLGHLVGPYAQPVRQGIKDVLLELYGKSGRNNVYRQSVYTDKDNNIQEIKSPAMSLLGETTPSTFYRQISEQVIEDGFLPRFVIIEYEGPNQYINEGAHYVTLPTRLGDALAQLATHCLEINQSMNMPNGGPIDVDMVPAAKAMFNSFSRYCTDQSNVKGITEGIKNVWSRVWLNSVKLAALVAVGCNHVQPRVEAHHAKWAIELVMTSVQKLVGKVETGEVAGSAETKQWSDFVRALRGLPDMTLERLETYGLTQVMRDHNVISHSFLHRRIGMLASFKNDKLGASAALKRLVQRAIDEGIFVPLAKYDPWVIEHKITGSAYALNVKALETSQT